MQRTIKFRQPLLNRDRSFNKFHYWGIFEDVFVGRELSGCEKGDDQQFTGLLDKNGVEIYAGDILNIISPGIWRHTVYWNDEYAGWFIKSKDGDDVNLWKIIAEKHYEVIGNIFQNKELLND